MQIVKQTGAEGAGSSQLDILPFYPQDGRVAAPAACLLAWFTETHSPSPGKVTFRDEGKDRHYLETDEGKAANWRKILPSFSTAACCYSMCPRAPELPMTALLSCLRAKRSRAWLQTPSSGCKKKHLQLMFQTAPREKEHRGSGQGMAPWKGFMGRTMLPRRLLMSLLQGLSYCLAGGVGFPQREGMFRGTVDSQETFLRASHIAFLHTQLAGAGRPLGLAKLRSKTCFCLVRFTSGGPSSTPKTVGQPATVAPPSSAHQALSLRKEG